MTPSQKDAMEWADFKGFIGDRWLAKHSRDHMQVLAAWVRELQAENEEINKRRWELEQHVGVMNAKGFKEVITSRIEEVQKARECAEKAEARVKGLEAIIGKFPTSKWESCLVEIDNLRSRLKSLEEKLGVAREGLVAIKSEAYGSKSWAYVVGLVNQVKAKLAEER